MKNLENIDFIRANYDLQIKALNQFMTDAYPFLPNRDNSLIRFGGGTALAVYYFRHRLSFDIDLFVTDCQVMSYLSPKHWLENTSLFNKDTYRDMSDHIRVLYLNGNIKIDILISENNTGDFFKDDSMLVFNDTVYVESAENIISKKIVYRKEDNLARDIIDLAVYLEKNPEGLELLLGKELICQDDLVVLCSSLQQLDRVEYAEEVEIVSPFAEFRSTAHQAPEIILESCRHFIK